MSDPNLSRTNPSSHSCLRTSITSVRSYTDCNRHTSPPTDAKHFHSASCDTIAPNTSHGPSVDHQPNSQKLWGCLLRTHNDRRFTVCRKTCGIHLPRATSYVWDPTPYTRACITVTRDFCYGRAWRTDTCLCVRHHTQDSGRPAGRQHWIGRCLRVGRDKAAKLEYTPTEPNCFPLIRSRVPLEMHAEMDG